MELHLLLVFGLLGMVFTPTLSEQVDATKLIGNSPYLLFTSKFMHYKEHSLKYTLANQSEILWPTLVHMPSRVDFHYAKGLAFFQPDTNTISSVPLRSNNSEPKAVIHVADADEQMLQAFAVDWVHDRLVYLTADTRPSTTGSAVMSTDLEGGDRKKIRDNGLDIVKSIAVDPHAGKLFFNVNLKKVVSCNLDGSDCKTVVRFSDKQDDVIVGFTLDLVNRRMLYINTLNKKSTGNRYVVKSVNYEGAQPKWLEYSWDKFEGKIARSVKAIQWSDGRLLAYLMTFNGDVERSFLMQSIKDGAVEEELIVYNAEKEPSTDAVLDTKLVLPGLQPATDPTVGGNTP